MPGLDLKVTFRLRAVQPCLEAHRCWVLALSSSKGFRNQLRNLSAGDRSQLALVGKNMALLCFQQVSLQG
jgi:hypothetical protein